MAFTLIAGLGAPFPHLCRRDHYRRGRLRLMLRTAQSLPLQGLLTLGFERARFPAQPPACYRASWQLPGPDSRRQATTSLPLSVHPKGLTANCLGARETRAR